MLLKMLILVLSLSTTCIVARFRHGKRGPRLIRACHETGSKHYGHSLNFIFSSSSESHFQMHIGSELVSVKKKICLSDGHECFGSRAHFGFCSYRTVCQQVYMSLHYNETQPTTIRIPNGCKYVRRETDYS